MPMERRKFITAAGCTAIAATAGCSSFGPPQSNNSNTTPTKEVPEAVRKVQPLAQGFAQSIRQHYPESRVFVRTEGDIVMEYQSSAENKDALTSEMNRIAALYGQVAKDHENLATLSIVSGGVQAVVGKPVVEAYVKGEINKEAYLETVEITGVNRKTDENAE